MATSDRFTRSRLIPERHGFSTRLGGVSSGRFASLNLAAKWGDSATNVDENRRRFAADVGFSASSLRTAKQVHGNHVLVIANANANADEADALVTALPNVTLGIFTADCVPILLSDGNGRVAVAHAGWRGTVLDIAARTIDSLVTLGARKENLRAALGPSICVRCFEVGEEVATEFASFPVAVIRRDLGAKPHVDLQLANRSQLLAAGLAVDRIDATPSCTMCDPSRYFSFRRDGGGIGQQLSVIVNAATY